MVGMVPKHQRDGTWVYTPIGAELSTVGLEEIGVYIDRHHNMVNQYIANCLTMELCLTAEQKPRMLLSRRWREQPALDILGKRAGHAAEEGGGGDGYGIIGGGGRGRVG